MVAPIGTISNGGVFVGSMMAIALMAATMQCRGRGITTNKIRATLARVALINYWR